MRCADEHVPTLACFPIPPSLAVVGGEHEEIFAIWLFSSGVREPVGQSIARRLATRMGARATTKVPVPGTEGYRLVPVTDEPYDPDELDEVLGRIRRRDTLLPRQA